MSEAPKYCVYCPIATSITCPESIDQREEDGATRYRPGPSCPFVLLDAKDGEILVLKNQLQKATREATELRELLDEHGIELDTEID